MTAANTSAAANDTTDVVRRMDSLFRKKTNGDASTDGLARIVESVLGGWGASGGGEREQRGGGRRRRRSIRAHRDGCGRRARHHVHPRAQRIRGAGIAVGRRLE